LSQQPTLNAAIVGLGRWGQNLVTAAASDTESRIRFIRGMTRTPSKVTDFGIAQGFEITDDFDSLLGDPKVQALVLATPHSMHCSQICAAAEAGKHIFVEKPLALTLGEAKDAVTACRRNKVTLAVGFNRRFLPALQALQKQNHTGSLGVPLHIDANFSGPFGFGFTDDMWRGTTAENPAGGMAALGIHMLDAMIHLLGPVQRVTALSKRRVLSAGVDDTTTVQLDFDSGATGTLTSLMATPLNWRLQLFGSEGWAAMADQQSLEVSRLEDLKESNQVFEAVDTLAAELNAFAAAIYEGTPFPISMSEALAGVAAMQAISQSAAAGGSVVQVEN
jgi:predicted dehydrogenase